MFGENIAAIVNSVLLSAVYLAGIGPTAIVAKLMKKHFLQEAVDKNADSYWKDLNLDKKDIKEYYRQF